MHSQASYNVVQYISHDYGMCIEVLSLILSFGHMPEPSYKHTCDMRELSFYDYLAHADSDMNVNDSK